MLGNSDGLANARWDRKTGGKRIITLPRGSTVLPFGKFKGKPIREVPEWYLRWAVVTIVHLRPHVRSAIANYLATLPRPQPPPAVVVDPSGIPPWEG